MRRLIEADALKDAIDCGWKPDMMVSQIWEIVDEVPTLVEYNGMLVNMGSWCKAEPKYASAKESRKHTCSICDGWGRKSFVFCPHCGAYMQWRG